MYSRLAGIYSKNIIEPQSLWDEIIEICLAPKKGDNLGIWIFLPIDLCLTDNIF